MTDGARRGQRRRVTLPDLSGTERQEKGPVNCLQMCVDARLTDELEAALLSDGTAGHF